MRCRVVGTARELTLRAPTYNEVPGEILVMRPTREWTAAGRTHVEGELVERRCDAQRLGLTPLALEDCGMWDPEA